MAAGETEEEREAREAAELQAYEQRLRAAAEQTGRAVGFLLRVNCTVAFGRRNDRPWPQLIVEGVVEPIDMLDDRLVLTAAGPLSARRPTVKRTGALVREAREALARR